MNLSDVSILIVEDETSLGETLQEYLSDKGYHCLWASTSRSAETLFEDYSPDVVLMDINLPDGHGFDLASKFRKEKKDLILLFLSALNDPQTRLKGLEIGGHDYITKPFALKELMLRLQRMLNLRQQNEDFPDEISIGPLKIWFKKFEVQDASGHISSLSQKECGILKLLYQRKGEAVTREEIIEKVWGPNKFPSNRTVDNYIVNLRKWAEGSPNALLEIASIRGVGYKLQIDFSEAR